MQGVADRGYDLYKVFQLNEECEASAELGQIVAGLVQRGSELESAREPREGHVTVSEETGKGDAPRAKERRFWRRTVFGLD